MCLWERASERVREREKAGCFPRSWARPVRQSALQLEPSLCQTHHWLSIFHYNTHITLASILWAIPSPPESISRQGGQQQSLLTRIFNGWYNTGTLLELGRERVDRDTLSLLFCIPFHNYETSQRYIKWRSISLKACCLEITETHFFIGRCPWDFVSSVSLSEERGILRCVTLLVSNCWVIVWFNLMLQPIYSKGDTLNDSFYCNHHNVKDVLWRELHN